MLTLSLWEWYSLWLKIMLSGLAAFATALIVMSLCMTLFRALVKWLDGLLEKPKFPRFKKPISAEYGPFNDQKREDEQ